MIQYIQTTKEDIELVMQIRLEMLIAEAREKGATEISLDATEQGRPLYESLGFKASSEAMVMNL